jgi:uncharacterized membrane protein YhaH (DUF805 family)
MSCCGIEQKREKSVMRFRQFFNFSGRVTRLTWWMGHFGSFIALGVTMLVISTVFAGDPLSRTGEAGLASSDEIGPFGLIVFSIAVLAYLWFNLSLNAKRWHDRDKSAWWMLISLIPLIGIWALIENGFLRGTQGPNRFGPDPLAEAPIRGTQARG